MVQYWTTLIICLAASQIVSVRQHHFSYRLSEKMVPAPTTWQKSLSLKKLKKNQMQSHSVREIRKCRKNTLMFVNKLPYKHLLKEFANDLQAISSEESPLVSILHEASQAYLAGIFDGYSNVCQNVAKKESSNFLMTLASLGLKRLVTIMTEDKELASRARTSDHPFPRNLISNLHMDHDHSDDDHHHGHHNEHHHNNDHDHDHHHHDHQHGHHHDHEDNQLQETGSIQANINQRVDDVIQRIRRRISSNVTISVLRD